LAKTKIISVFETQHGKNTKIMKKNILLSVILLLAVYSNAQIVNISYANFKVDCNEEYLGSAEKRIIDCCKASYDKNAIVNARFLNHQSFSSDPI